MLAVVKIGFCESVDIKIQYFVKHHQCRAGVCNDFACVRAYVPIGDYVHKVHKRDSLLTRTSKIGYLCDRNSVCQHGNCRNKIAHDVTTVTP